MTLSDEIVVEDAILGIGGFYLFAAKCDFTSRTKELTKVETSLWTNRDLIGMGLLRMGLFYRYVMGIPFPAEFVGEL